MTQRLTSGFFVAAYLRRLGHEGVPAALRRRGDEKAGTIFVKIDRLDGTADLYGPAPQSAIMDDGERRFTRLMAEAPSFDIEHRLSKELRYDSDIWIVESEDRKGRSFLPLESQQA